MVNTPIDEIIDYPMKVAYAIGNDSTIISLLADKQNLVAGTDEAYDVYDKYIFDYDYVDQTTIESFAYICVEAEINKRVSPTMHQVCLYVTVYCHKDYMPLDHQKFPGLAGNRRDNIVRCVCDLLDKQHIYGIGCLQLESVRTRPAPFGFTAREMTYTIPDFAIE